MAFQSVPHVGKEPFEAVHIGRIVLRPDKGKQLPTLRGDQMILGSVHHCQRRMDLGSDTRFSFFESISESVMMSS